MSTVADYLAVLPQWAVCSARFVGFISIFPLFSWMSFPPRLSTLAAACFGLPVVATMPATVAERLAEMPLWAVGTVSLREYFVGGTLAVVAAIPFWAVAGAGDAVDTYRGSSAGGLFDPALAEQTSIFSATMMTMALAIFVASGGLFASLMVLYASFSVIEIGPLLTQWDGDRIAGLGGIAHNIYLGALMQGAALLIALVVAEVGMALATRSARQIHLFDLSMSVKSLAFAVLLPILAPSIVAAVSRHIARVPDLLRAAQGLFP